MLLLCSQQATLRHEWTQHLFAAASAGGSDDTSRGGPHGSTHAGSGPCLLCLAHAGTNLAPAPAAPGLVLLAPTDVAARSAGRIASRPTAVARLSNRGPPQA